MSNDISQSNLNLTPEEKRTYSRLFQEADPDGLGVVTGEVAVRFFERTRLSPTVLGAIWQIGDIENRGLLTPAGFSVVLRLIGHAQAGREPSIELSRSPGPLPKLETAPGASSISTTQQLQASTGPIRIPPLVPEKVSEYASLFEKAGAQGGLLSGESARQVFERARLSNEILGQIWNLADSDQKGALNVTDFVIAMHFLTALRSGAMRALPNALPAGLYEAASRKSMQPNPPNIPRQYSGAAPQRTQSPATRPYGNPLIQQSSGNDWLVTLRDKARFDEIFDGIDKSRRGFITGDQAVSFFSDSQLPEELLAQIWDLSDINSEGQLNRDEFAVAMYLIRQERSKRGDNRGALPVSLPPKLIPPSMRQQTVPSSQTTAPVFDNAAFATKKSQSAADDLFGLDALADGGQSSPVASPRNMESPKAMPSGHTGRAPLAGFKPFIPTSSFGQGLASQNTGTSISSSRQQNEPITTTEEDLLGDAHPEMAQKVSSGTSELSNMSNQIGQLRGQMQEVQKKKSTLDDSLTQSIGQKKDLELRLAQFRTQYEAEIREVKLLEERLTSSRNETRKLQQEIAMVEGAHKDLATQHQQLQLSIQADQGENNILKQRMQELNVEIGKLRVEVEKAKSDSRQQKGLIAINKKQVTTLEADTAGLQHDLSTASNQPAGAPASPSLQDSARSTSTREASPARPESTNPFSKQSVRSALGSPDIARNVTQSKLDTFDSFFGNETSASDPAFSVNYFEHSPENSKEPARDGNPSDSHLFPQRSFGLNLPPSSAGFNEQLEGHSADTEPNRSFSGDKSHPAAPSAMTNDQPGRPVFEDSERDSKQERNIKTDNSSNDESIAVGSPGASSQLQDEAQHPSIPGAFPGEIPNPIDPPNFKASQLPESAASGSEFDALFRRTTEQSTPHDRPQPSRSEFPPIQDVESDESESENGFEDNFSPSSGPTEHQIPSDEPIDTGKQRLATVQPSNPKKAEEVRDNTLSANHSSLVGNEMSATPKVAETEATYASQSSAQNRVLLSPPKDISSSPQTIAQPVPQIDPTTTGDFAQTIASAVSANDSRVLSGSSAPITLPSSHSVSAKAAPDDFDSAFQDLTDAQEEKESNFPMSKGPEPSLNFDPSFVTSNIVPPNTMSLRAQEEEQTTSSAGQSRPHTNFAEFESQLNKPQVFPSNHEESLVSGQAAASTAVGSDWDAMFADLHKSATETAASDPTEPHVIDHATTDSFPESKMISSTLNSTLDRPRMGRAISQGTEHDDPILKTLTNMGYARDMALQALEKYDYNLDKAADYLASKA